MMKDVFTFESVWTEFEKESPLVISKDHLFVFDLIDSTNTECKRRISNKGLLVDSEGQLTEDGKSFHKSVLAASEQTAGHGRLGRAFYSPSETGIYFSLIYVPCPCVCYSAGAAVTGESGCYGEKVPVGETSGCLKEHVPVGDNGSCLGEQNGCLKKQEIVCKQSGLLEEQGAGGFDPARFTVTAAVGVCRAIERLFGKKAEIKWVNDIYLEGKKVCGILTEGVTNKEGKIEAAIIGIGINISRNKNLPEELSNKVGGIISSEENAESFRAKFLASVVKEIIHSLDTKENIIPEYRSRSMLKGKQLTVTPLIGSSETYEAKVLDITDDAGLLVELCSGEKKVLHSGEVTLH